MNLVTQQDLEVMNKQDDVTLAQWNCLMNHWGWPEALADAPNDKSLPPNEWSKSGRRSQVMQFIEDRVGKRLISWEHNKKTMTSKEFNDFYAGYYLGDNAARIRHDDNLKKQCGITA